jgi:hypothetical protein
MLTVWKALDVNRKTHARVGHVGKMMPITDLRDVGQCRSESAFGLAELRDGHGAL